MKLHFDEELKELKNSMLKMGILVEEMFDKTTKGLLDKGSFVVLDIFRADKKVDRIEVEIDELAHSLIARRQPIAHDLRFITMILKINGDLERIGDHVVNIAERVDLVNLEILRMEKSVLRMAAIVKGMLHDSLNSFIEGNVELARKVLTQDDEVDKINYEIYETFQNRMKEYPEEVSSDVNIIMISHNFERIADLATNVAEDTIYMEEGKDIRHHSTNG